MSIIALKGVFCVSFDHSFAQNEPNMFLLLQSRRTCSYIGLSWRMERTNCIFRHKATLLCQFSPLSPLRFRQTSVSPSWLTYTHMLLFWIIPTSKAAKWTKTENRGQNFLSQYNIPDIHCPLTWCWLNQLTQLSSLASTVHTTLECEFNLGCDARDRTAFPCKILPVVLEKM